MALCHHQPGPGLWVWLLRAQPWAERSPGAGGLSSGRDALKGLLPNTAERFSTFLRVLRWDGLWGERGIRKIAQ